MTLESTDPHPPATAANIARALPQQAHANPTAAAIRLGDQILDYASLEAASHAAAGLLRAAGVESGDRVGLVMPNLPAFPMFYYAILRLGGVVVPLNPLLKANEIGYVLHDAGIRTIVVFESFAGETQTAAADIGATVLVVSAAGLEAELAGAAPVAEVAAVGPHDTAVILYTSGTTGQPKGAELTHHNIGSNVATVLETLFPMAPGDVIFGGLPLFHSFGQTVALNASITAGSCLSLLPKFDPVAALRMLEEHQVSIFMGVPSMYVALLNTPSPYGDREVDTSRLTKCVSGGSSLPVEVLKSFEDRFGSSIFEGYGLSETSPVASFNHPDQPARPGSIGTPIRGCEFRLVDANDNEITDPSTAGEICIRGENVMKGYLNRPDDTATAMRGGWFHTGDLARRDDDGFYYIVDRVKDMIIRNGFNVYPREIEEVLYSHPAVQEAAVVGVPDPLHGEEIGALITLKDGAAASADELIAYAKDRVAAYKYPRHINFGPVPKGPTGKILKREITLTPDPAKTDS